MPASRPPNRSVLKLETSPRAAWSDSFLRTRAHRISTRTSRNDRSPPAARSPLQVLAQHHPGVVHAFKVRALSLRLTAPNFRPRSRWFPAASRPVTPTHRGSLRALRGSMRPHLLLRGVRPPSRTFLGTARALITASQDSIEHSRRLIGSSLSCNAASSPFAMHPRRSQAENSIGTFDCCTDWHTVCVSPHRPAAGRATRWSFSCTAAERRPTTARPRGRREGRMDRSGTEKAGDGDERSDLQPRASIGRRELHVGARPAGWHHHPDRGAGQAAGGRVRVEALLGRAAPGSPAPAARAGCSGIW